MQSFDKDNLTAVEAREFVQSIAFGPIAFHAARALVQLGVLSLIEQARPHGITLEEVAKRLGLSIYGTRVLMEAGLGVGLLTLSDQRFRVTRAGGCLLHDRMTRVNMDFVNDICYRGMLDLAKSVQEGKPEGLKVFGAWATIYEALAHLPPHARSSWLNFDHYYSDAAFRDALPLVFRFKPKRILDVGGNTGRWALQCVRFSKDVEVCIGDLPSQLEMAKEAVQSHAGSERITFAPLDVLKPESAIPSGFDTLWMSQFLDCFSEDQIHSILAKCRRTMDAGSRLFILEPFWDRQRFKASAFSLQMTSLYFTAMANGNSQMYRSHVVLDLLKDQGFEIDQQVDHLGIAHTLVVCRSP